GEGLGESLVVCLLRPLGADLQAGLLEHHPDLAGRQAVRLPDLALVLPRGALAAALLAGPRRRRRDLATGPVDLVHARGDGVLSALAPHPRGVRELVGGGVQRVAVVLLVRSHPLDLDAGAGGPRPDRLDDRHDQREVRLGAVPEIGATSRRVQSISCTPEETGSCRRLLRIPAAFASSSAAVFSG